MSSTAPATLCPGTAQSLQAPRRRAGPFSPAAGNTWDRNPCLRTSVAMARLGMLRTPTVIIDTAKRKVSKYRLDCLQEDKAFLPLTVRRGVAVPSRHGELIAQPIARRAATLFFPRGSRAPCHYGTARGVRARRTAHTHTHTTPDGGQHLGSRHFSSPSTSGRLHGKFVRFLYFLPAAIGQENSPHKELCQQRGAFFYQHRSCVDVACAQACALRMGGAAPPRRQAHFQARSAGRPRCALGRIIASL